jgi:hypothetical protein
LIRVVSETACARRAKREAAELKKLISMGVCHDWQKRKGRA